MAMPSDASRQDGAARMRLLRQRRRDGLRVIPLEIRDTEIAMLLERGLLARAEHDDPIA